VGRLVPVEWPFRPAEPGKLRSKSVGDLLKYAPLLVPIDPAHDGPQGSLAEAPAVRQKKNLFLNVRSQIEQLHDLGDPRSRHPAEPGQFGIIPHRLIAHQPLKPDGERHQPGDAGNGAATRFAIGRPLL
jgi:hypothetical protein